MPLVKVSRDEAETKLAGGPLGIGESHDKPEARQFLIRLIDQRLVKVLFLEIPREQEKTFDKCLAKAVMAKQGGLPANQVHAYLQPMDGFLQSPREMPFSDLISYAMSRGVRIVFADISFRRPDLAAKPDGLNRRNKAVDKVFNDASFMSGTNGGAGCVILFGAEHFESDAFGLKDFIGDNINQQLYWVDLS